MIDFLRNFRGFMVSAFSALFGTGINDSPENWAERDETIEPESGLKEIET